MGYYKIAFGKLEKETKIDELSRVVLEGALLNIENEGDREKLQREYEEGSPILYNAKKIDTYLFLFIAVKKKRTSRQIDWRRYDIKEEKFEDMASSQVIL